jgi:hypothetical protein
MFIGKHAFNKNNFGEAVDWLSAAYKFSTAERVNTTSPDEVLPFLQTAKHVVSTIDVSIQ